MIARPVESQAEDSPGPRRVSRGFDVLCAVLGVSVLAYSALRALKVPITFDEAYTYLVYVKASVSKILPLDPAQTIPPLTANNHVLNSLLTKGAAGLFGPAPFSLRLPNVLAHALFLVCSYSILRRHASGLLRAMGFIVVAANPFQIEFFALCRGYGLSLALLAASVERLDRAVSEERRPLRYFVSSALLAGLAVMSNYTLLDVFVPLAAVAAAAPLLGGPPPARLGKVLRSGALSAMPFLVVFIAMAIPFAASFEILRKTAFWFGGSRGFVPDTVFSLAEGTLYGRAGAAAAPAILSAVVAAAVVLFGAVSLAAGNSARGENRLLKVVLSLLAGSALLSWLQHALLGSAYLEGRTALFFLPLTALALVLAAAGLPAGWRRAGEATVAILALAAWWNTSRCANLRYSYTWKYDADTPRMLRDLDGLTRSARVAGPVRLGVDWHFVPGVEYYRTVGKLGWLSPVDRESLWREGNDYVYFPAETAAEAKRRGVRLLRGYPTSGNLLGLAPEPPSTRTEALPRWEGARPAGPGEATPPR